MATAIVTPISASKAYAFEAYVRGVLTQGLPPEEIVWLFVVQQQHAGNLPERIARLKQQEGERFAGIRALEVFVPIDEQYLTPPYEYLTWKQRAQIAAFLRGTGFAYVRDYLPECDRVLSLGSDVILSQCDDLEKLVTTDKPLLSGVVLARLRHFPLVLHYYPDKTETLDSWAPWHDHPRDRLFSCDWTGMDIMAIQRSVLEAVDQRDYVLADYRVGEDGWFCLKVKETLGAATWVDPTVMPYHVHEDGVPLWAGGTVPPAGIMIACPQCAYRATALKSYKDVAGNCPVCGTFFYFDSWEDPRPACSPPYRLLGGS